MLNSLWYLAIVPGIPVAAFLGWTKWYVHQRNVRSRRPFVEMARPAGWSLQNCLTDLMDNFTADFMAAVVVGVTAWALSVSGKIPPVFILITGFLACSMLLYRAARTITSAVNYRLGLLGEQVVGQILDQLSCDALHVFHDLEVKEPGNKPWNIDHIVVTPAGVFAIETKTRRKPREVSSDGQQSHKVVFDGHQPNFPHPMGFDRHGLDQTQRNATWLSDKLTALNGCPVSVIPALVLPGWWVERKGKSNISVLNAKELPGFFKNRTPVLSPERQRAIKAQLDERCRIDLS
ncbi:MAG: nuclease-related domain-containing protein [Luteolibacter sp.]|uniref:nuclease-related domain-containing protein n=1 Tax=Luteolibacter sp. TaxID=1962973 RepID=UPI0032651FC4